MKLTRFVVNLSGCCPSHPGSRVATTALAWLDRVGPAVRRIARAEGRPVLARIA